MFFWMSKQGSHFGQSSSIFKYLDPALQLFFCNNSVSSRDKYNSRLTSIIRRMWNLRVKNHNFVIKRVFFKCLNVKELVKNTFNCYFWLYLININHNEIRGSKLRRSGFVRTQELARYYTIHHTHTLLTTTFPCLKLFWKAKQKCNN